MNIKKVLFFILVITIALMNIKYMQDWSYLEKILIRLPQVLIILFIYVRYIRDEGVNKKKFWRFSNNILHYTVLFVGILVFIGAMIFNVVYLGGLDTSDIKSQLIIAKDTPIALWFIVIPLYVLLSFPFYYAVVQYTRLSFRIALWTYENNKKLILPVLIIEDIFFTLILSVLV